MQISDILTPKSVKLFSGCSSKKRLFHNLADLAAQAYGLDSDTVVQALMDREALGPTAVGHGIALPHARLAGLSQVCGAFIRLEKPMDFKAVDKKPVDLAFALLAPLDAGVDHLKALALVSRTMRDDGLCTKLRANADPATLFTILTEHINVKAA